MTILITGICGFIGTNIALAARKKNYKVIGIDSLVRKKTEENIPILERVGVTIIRGDIRNKEDFTRLPNAIDSIIHLAANSGVPWSLEDPVYDFETNARGTLNVLEFAKERGKIPLIFASTNRVYSDLVNEIPLKQNATRYTFDKEEKSWLTGSSYMGISEQFSIDGFGKYLHSPYGVSKLAGDLYCQEYCNIYGIPTVINRMSCVYGYYQKGVSDQGWVDHFMRTIGFGDRKVTVFGNGKQVRDMIWGEDIAQLYLKELEHIKKVKGEVFNIGGGIKNTLSILEAIQIIEEISEKKAIITYKPWRHADQKLYISDIQKVKDKIGWEPTISPKQGLTLMYKKFQKNSTSY